MSVHYVYRIFDADGALLYVGATQDVETRLYHLTALCNRARYGDVARRMEYHTVEEYPTRREAFDAERAAIAAESPLFNIQSKRRSA